MNRQEIADRVFKVKWDILPGGNPLTDHEKVKDFGKICEAAYGAVTQHPRMTEIDPQWRLWMGMAKEAEVALPYSTPMERFGGKFPSYLPEEAEVIKRWSLHGAQAKEEPTLLLTGGATGSGKSTLLDKIVKQELPHAVMLDPDEGVLENHGPYLWARAVLKMAYDRPIAPGTSVEDIIAQRNEWRMPPYNIFRAASNAINTEIAHEVVANAYDAAFGFTGIKGYGFNVQLPAYKEAGFMLDYLPVFARLDVRDTLESYRERPADPQDRLNKARDFMAALPDYFGLCDRVRLYICDLGHQFVHAATAYQGNAIIHHGRSMAGIYDIMGDEQRRALAVGKSDIAKGIGDARDFLITIFEQPTPASRAGLVSRTDSSLKS